MRRSHVLAAIAISVGAVLAAAFAFVLIASGGGSSGAAADPAHTPPAAARTLLVSMQRAPASQPGMLLHGRLVGGRLPVAATTGEVLSDEDCTPDAAGISHCRNAIRLADGHTIVVRHPHDMRRVPCLTPGEHVRVRPV
jgi:hypothetical protein